MIKAGGRLAPNRQSRPDQRSSPPARCFVGGCVCRGLGLGLDGGLCGASAWRGTPVHRVGHIHRSIHLAHWTAEPCTLAIGGRLGFGCLDLIHQTGNISDASPSNPSEHRRCHHPVHHFVHHLIAGLGTPPHPLRRRHGGRRRFRRLFSRSDRNPRPNGCRGLGCRRRLALRH